jgi:ATP-dependent Clp protease ATP-binding subunit ClpA
MFERFTEAARAVVTGAYVEARGLGHEDIGCEHLLIAVASAPDGPARSALLAAGVTPEALRSAVREIGAEPPAGPDADALATIGIDLDAVRRSVERTFGPGALDRRARRRRCADRMRMTAPSKRALERSVHAAVARGDRRIGSEHILLGILDVPESGASEALVRIGVTPERVLQQLEPA